MTFPWTKKPNREAELAQAAELGASRAIELFAGAFVQPSQAPRGVFALDNPIFFATPASPKRKPLQILSVDDCRRIADAYDIIRGPIEVLKRQVRTHPVYVAAIDPDDKSERTKKRIKEAQTFFTTAGGNGKFGQPRTNFETEWIEDLLVTGVFAIYRERTNGGQLYRQTAIDSGTIRLRIDAYGFDETEPYEQWIQGVPVRKFEAKELYYDGTNARTWNPYCISPIEWLFSPILAGIKADEWNTTWLTDGNAPGDDIFTLPEALTTDQISTYISIFDEVLSGNTRERRKVRFLPGGSERLSPGTRREMEFQEFEMWLLRRCYSIFGVSPASAGFAGDQYKTSQDAAHDNTADFGVGALIAKRKELYDDTLVQLGYPDLEVTDRLDVEDFSTVAATVEGLVAGGILTVNEARKRLGYEPIQEDDSQDMNQKGQKNEKETEGA